MRPAMSCALSVMNLLTGGAAAIGSTTEKSLEDVQAVRILKEFRAPGGDQDRQFGYSVAIDGDLAFVADDQGDADALGSGWIHLLRVDEPENTEPVILRAPDRKWPDRFGAAMSLKAGNLLVGAPMDAEHGWDAGAVWLFQQRDDDWRLTDRLHPRTAEPGARFGAAVDMEGDLAVVGSPRSDGTGLDCGSVDVFTRNRGHWQVDSVLVAPDQASGDFFGSSVACHDRWIAVGAWGDDDHGEKTGAVWLFTREHESWKAVQKIVPPEAVSRDRFGWRVAFVADQLVVSACGFEDSKGRLHVHDWDGRRWVPTIHLEDPRGRSGDWFGFALSAREDLLVVGSPGTTAHAEWSGRVAVYRRGDEATWHRLGAVSSKSDLGEQPVQFGWAVATDGNRVMVGRIDDADGPSVAGRAWLLGLPEPSDGRGRPSDVPGNQTGSVRNR